MKSQPVFAIFLFIGVSENMLTLSTEIGATCDVSKPTYQPQDMLHRWFVCFSYIFGIMNGMKASNQQFGASSRIRCQQLYIRHIVVPARSETSHPLGKRNLSRCWFL